MYLIQGVIALEVVKKAEKENTIIMRLTEPGGESSQAVLRFFSEKVQYLEYTDLMEWSAKDRLPVQNNQAAITLAPFEIKTFFLRVK